MFFRKVLLMIKKIFMRGLVAVVPIAVTLALLIWVIMLTEQYSSIPIKKFIGRQYYYPGYGILLSLVTIFLVGSIINNWLIDKFYQLSDRFFSRIPLVKTLYRSVTDLMSFFKASEKERRESVVIVEIAGMKMVGLVTREKFNDLPKGVADKGDVAVFLPFSYQIGGYTVIMPRKNVKHVDMTVEEGLRFTMTAGASKAVDEVESKEE